MSQNAPVSSESPAQIENLVGAVKGFTQSYNLLNEAPFPHGYAAAVGQSLEFLKSCHTEALKKALAHPEAGSCEDLKPFMKQTDTAKEGENVIRIEDKKGKTKGSKGSGTKKPAGKRKASPKKS